MNIHRKSLPKPEKFSKMSKKSRWKNRKSEIGFDSSIKLYVRAPKMWTKYWCHPLCCPQLKKMSSRVFLKLVHFGAKSSQNRWFPVLSTGFFTFGPNFNELVWADYWELRGNGRLKMKLLMRTLQIRRVLRAVIWYLATEVKSPKQVFLIQKNLF